jgi:uncharacterized secreted repeat protein (TIGR03808 family)
MTIDRRSILSGSMVVGLTGVAAANAGPRSERETGRVAAAELPSAVELGLKPGAARDQSAALQAAIDQAANRAAPLLLPLGRFRTARLQLRPGTHIIGTSRSTTLEFVGGETFLVGEGDGIALEALVLDGAYRTLDIGQANALVSLKKSRGLALRDLEITRSIANGVTLEGCAGVVSDCAITAALMAGLHSLDATGLQILHNRLPTALTTASRSGARRRERTAASSPATASSASAPTAAAPDKTATGSTRSAPAACL